MPSSHGIAACTPASALLRMAPLRSLLRSIAIVLQ
jgi:hypothetical protein